MVAKRFLMKVWGLNCRPGDFVALSTKGAGGWVDYCYPYEEIGSRLDRWLEHHQQDDCYFCPLPFSGRRRSKNLVSTSRLLWSDIDDGDPKIDPPHVLWESSPGRKQGLWILPDHIPAMKAAERSKQVAYRIGGDRGGWDVTQVLRIPGTKNYKYPSAPTVKLLYWKKPVDPMNRWRSIIPPELMERICGSAEVGTRSDGLWALEHELLKLKIPRDDVIQILRDSDWNKYRGRPDEDERFAVEMEKHGAIDVAKPIVKSFSDIMEYVGEEEWLVQDYWMCESHGIVSAHPKSFKTTLVLDMLFSIASGLPFMGKPVKQGPVMFIQNENHARIIRRLLIGIAKNKNINNLVNTGTCEYHNGRIIIRRGNYSIPMYEFVQPTGFSFSNEAMLVPLEETIDKYRPLVITLDPLYLMMGGKDLNSAMDLNPVLNWCLYIRNKYKCSVILIHHNSKASESSLGGQRMLGSTTLHGWVDSAWYISPVDKEEGIVKLEREFRSADVGPGITIQVYKNKVYCPEIIKKVDESEPVIAALSKGENSVSGITNDCPWKLRAKTIQILEKLEKEGYVLQLRNKKWKLK
jgi:AAA domain/RepB DNA-primase from phage plasmid